MVNFLSIVLLLSSFMVCSVLNIGAQTTEFTYQGSLRDGANLANGNYDFEFALFDALTAGAQVGSTLTRNTVAVSNGIFTVPLDFGGAFPGPSRFLEIRVRPTGGGSFNALSPRQQIDSAPYSVKSLNTDSATTAINADQLGGVAASQYVVTSDPRMADSRSPTAGSGNYVQNTTSPQASTNFNISGTGTAIIFSATTQFNIGANRILTNAGSNNILVGVGAGAVNAGSGNSFVGRSSGQANTTGFDNSFVGWSAGISNTTGNDNSFVGRGAGNANTTGNDNTFVGRTAGGFNTAGHSNAFIGLVAGEANSTGNNNSFFGTRAGNSNTTGSKNVIVGENADVGGGDLINATAIGADSLVTQNNSLVLGGINGVNSATADTNVGIGTTAPTQKLHVVGNSLFTGNLTVNGTLTAALPSGSSNYIQNQNAGAQSSSNFNISGTGSAGIFNAATQYNIGGSRVLSGAGTGNIFAGVSSGQANTSGSNNAFFGVGSGQVNTLGSGNAFFGFGSGKANTGGGNNAFFGINAGQANTTGSGNSFFGKDAGFFTTGTVNTFVGGTAGFNNNTGIGNTFIGNSAGSSNGSGSYNINLGYQSDVGAANLTNAIAIGRLALVTQSNSMVLGSINGVNFASDDTNVGIGTTAPSNRLHISAAGGNIVMGDPGCSAGFTGIGFGATLSGCSNYSMLGNGTDTIISRPAGGVIDFRMGNISQVSINNSGLFSIGALGAAGATALCRNASNQISSCSSSLRYKTNIAGYNKGMSLVRQLNPISFDWKESGMNDVGLGAEDIARIDPRFVTYNDKGEVEGVKYDRLNVVLVNAVKEQQAQIDTLQRQINEQKAEIDAFKELVCSQNPTAKVCANRK